MAEKELQVREKREVQTEAEPTRPGAVFMPPVDIFETDKEITLLADMPGVSSDRVTIDLRDDRLTISGEVEPQGSDQEKFLLQEYQVGRYQRTFTLSDRIDQAGINATMKGGVLRLILPKAAKAVPRKIEVKAG